MRAEVLDPRVDPRWRELLERAEEATIFHHPAWVDLLARQYRYEVEAVCLLDERDRVVAGVPWMRVESRLTGRRLVALPFSDACAPLVEHGTEQELAAALEERRSEHGLGLELRGPLPALSPSAPQRYWRHVLALSNDAEAVARAASAAARRGVAKARRERLAFERRTDSAALDAFFRLHVRTRRDQGAPTQPRSFILALERLFHAGHGFVALVADEAQPVAAAIFLRYGRHLTYKYGASDRAALPRRPNNLLFAEVIRWACESGLRELDFGRTDLTADGLRSFKRGWGATESALHYTYAGMPPPAGEASLAQRALRPAIRWSPPVVGRVVGAALYRHFG